jgi:hypothetical protein
MTTNILKNASDYEIYFSHQSDTRPFNRGASKNIGFLAMKQKYPNDYKNITFIFNDVDTMPFTNLFSYDTQPGTVTHYYGFKYALGGIVVIKGQDFETINGYPCYWGWGNEDNCLQTRCVRYGINIDRSDFYPIGSPNILQLFDGITRLINKTDAYRGVTDNGSDGLSTITSLNFTIDTTSDDPKDNIYVVSSPRIWYVNIKQFNTLVSSSETFHKYDLREPPVRIIQNNQLDIVIPSEQEGGSSFATMNDWTNIPSQPPKPKTISRPSQTIPLAQPSGKSFFQPPPVPNPLNTRKMVSKKKHLLFV